MKLYCYCRQMMTEMHNVAVDENEEWYMCPQCMRGVCVEIQA